MIDLELATYGAFKYFAYHEVLDSLTSRLLIKSFVKRDLKKEQEDKEDKMDQNESEDIEDNPFEEESRTKQLQVK